MMKRILALLLVLTLVVGYAPVPALAEDTVADACPLCGQADCSGEDAHPNWCYTCEADPCEDETGHPKCEVCEKIGCKEHAQEAPAETPAPLTLEESAGDESVSDSETSSDDSGETPDAGSNETETEDAADADENNTGDNAADTADSNTGDETGDNTEDPAQGSQPQICTTCGKEDCASSHETWCDICKIDDCGREHVVCNKCGTVDCASAHENWCDNCKIDDCGKTHVICDKCGTVDCTREHVICDKCGTVDCTKEHVICDKCGAVDCTKEHTICEYCETVDCTKEHIVCEECEALADDSGALHHKDTCSQYVPPVVEEEENTPKVGDRIWIKSGSNVYKSANSKKGYVLKGSYEVEITKVVTDKDGKVIAYHFNFTHLGIGEAALSLGGYKYVKAEDTTTEKPSDVVIGEENTCTCGDTAPESLANHADSCPRKIFVKTLFEGKTAEEIYAGWESFDEATKADILDMLSVYDSAKLEELNRLLGKKEDGVFAETTVDGVALKILAPEGAFPEGTEMAVNNRNRIDFSGAIKSVLKDLDPDSNILKLITMDISFVHDGKEVQPAVPVELHFEVAASEIPGSAKRAYVFHMTNSGAAEIVGEFPEISSGSDLLLDVTAYSFSSYVIGFSDQTYDAKLLKNALSGDSRYSIKEFSANLFNYDMTQFNNYIDGLTGQKFLKFVTDSDTSFSPNVGGAFATQGIVKKSLKNGYPEMTYGFDNGAYIFNTTPYPGKTVAANKNFEFVYDNQTGYYEYNSALNHAQINGSKVQLYTDTLGPYNFTQQFALNSFTGYHHLSARPTYSGGMLTVKTSGSDPYFTYDTTRYTVGEYSKLYLRLHSNTTETLQVFFNFNGNGFSEAKSVSLSMKTGWNEYYFDFSGLSSGTLYGVRIDVGSSSGKTYQISKMALIRNTAGLKNMSSAGFYPFEVIENSYPNQYKEFDKAGWASDLRGEKESSVATRSMYDAYATSYEKVPTDKFHFGMSMETNFYLPQSRTIDGTSGGAPIIFEFSGDDDLWVFVDGKLALDIGGGHTIVSGSINFTTGEVQVSKAKQLTSATSAGSASAMTGKLADALRTPGNHTLKIFYLERFSTASNCRIKFNLPAVPTGNVSVSKAVKETNNYPIEDDLTFTFQAEVNGSVYANKNYAVVTVNDKGVITGQSSGKTDGNGQFTLKHNQTAYFDGISENSSIKITEVKPTDAEHSIYKSTTVNGAAGYVGTGTTSANGIINFSYINTYEAVRNTDIVVHKTANNVRSDVDSAENQSYIFQVKGNDADNKHIDMLVTVNITDYDASGTGTGSVTIKDVPVGSYTVTELTNWSWRYSAVKSTLTQTAAYPMAESNHFRFTNNRSWIYWLSGDNFCENQFTVKSVSGN